MKKMNKITRSNVSKEQKHYAAFYCKIKFFLNDTGSAGFLVSSFFFYLNIAFQVHFQLDGGSCEQEEVRRDLLFVEEQNMYVACAISCSITDIKCYY